MATVHPYQPKHITPTDEQVAVQMSAERTLIIEANAGAAKTTTLALRMAQAWTTGMPPERCLARPGLAGWGRRQSRCGPCWYCRQLALA